MADTEPQESMRLDKWLWAARFFKTRPLAQKAVEGGKVHLNGQRTKPGKEVRIGSRLNISIGSLDWAIEILALPSQRRPAAEAAGFYRENTTSAARRKALIEQQKEERRLNPQPMTQKPGKRDRRLIHRFTSGT